MAQVIIIHPVIIISMNMQPGIAGIRVEESHWELDHSRLVRSTEIVQRAIEELSAVIGVGHKDGQQHMRICITHEGLVHASHTLLS
jgi:hypothetical protein